MLRGWEVYKRLSEVKPGLGEMYRTRNASRGLPSSFCVCNHIDEDSCQPWGWSSSAAALPSRGLIGPPESGECSVSTGRQRALGGRGPNEPLSFFKQARCAGWRGQVVHVRRGAFCRVDSWGEGGVGHAPRRE